MAHLCPPWGTPLRISAEASTGSEGSTASSSPEGTLRVWEKPFYSNTSSQLPREPNRTTDVPDSLSSMKLNIPISPLYMYAKNNFETSKYWTISPLLDRHLLQSLFYHKYREKYSSCRIHILRKWRASKS